MKRLLQVSVILIAVACGFVACSEDDESDDFVIDYSSLPNPAKAFKEAHFGEATVTLVKERYLAELDGTFYNLFLSTGFEVDFAKNGLWTIINGGNTKALPETLFVKQEGEDDKPQVPMAIKVYVNTNYPKLLMTRIEKKSSGFKLKLSDGTALSFDANGEPLK